MELAKLLIVGEPHEFQFCVAQFCTKDLQCVMLMAMRISVHTLVSLSLSARQPSWQLTTSQVSPAASPDFSDVWPSHGTSFLPAAEGLWLDGRSLLCIQLLCCSLQKSFLPVCTPNSC